jgi:5'-3' exonuclease
MARLHLIDGTLELFRAHFSPRPGHSARDGSDAKASVAFAAQLLALRGDVEERPTHAAIAFDNPIRSFRNDLFAGYKSDEGVPLELRSQFDRVEKIARALGFVVWSFPDFEADDALASGVKRYAPSFDQVRILSSDKDLGPCLDVGVDGNVILVDRIGKRLIDAAAVFEARGVRPSQIPDFLALVGDAADGIPGLKGFGAKGASALLGRYAALEEIPHAPGESWDVKVRGAEKLFATFAAGRADALLYKTLATLRWDVPLTEAADDLALGAIDVAALEALAAELAAPKLVERALKVVPAT